jgi:periplasmic divalent cation tolerance protein
MSQRILILTTAGSQEEARSIARELVERRLAACVNMISPVHSIYRWQGEIEEATEYLLVIKTAKSREAAVQAVIRELHSYELPESLSVAIEGGAPAYLAWLDSCL